MVPLVTRTARWRRAARDGERGPCHPVIFSSEMRALFNHSGDRTRVQWSSGSDFEQILGYEDGAFKVHAGCFDPHSIGDFRIVGRHEVREDEHLDAGIVGDAPRILCPRVVRENAPFERGRVRDPRDQAVNPRLVQSVMDEDIGASRELDEGV